MYVTGLQVVDLMLKIMKNHKTSIHENREKIQRTKNQVYLSFVPMSVRYVDAFCQSILKTKPNKNIMMMPHKLVCTPKVERFNAFIITFALIE